MSVEQRLETLERAIRRWRLIGITTGGLLVVVVCLGAAGPDKKGGELVLDKLVIRDSQGRERIVLGTSPDGKASVKHLDANRKVRITAVTFPDGKAEVSHLDANQKNRIVARTMPDGSAAVKHYDENEGLRISAFTSSFPHGEAAVLHVDPDRKVRISARTFPKSSRFRSGVRVNGDAIISHDGVKTFN